MSRGFSPPLRILVVDDHPVFRHGLVALIEGAAGMEVAGEASTGKEAVEQFRSCRPDVTLLDMQLPDMAGDRVVSAIHRVTPQARIVVLTAYGGDGAARRALAAGAQGYLLKTSLVDELIDSILAVHAGQHRIDAEIAQQLSDFQGAESLSERELDVLRGVAAGLENKQIARRLALAPDTVKEYLSNAMAKLRASNRAHAISIAQKRGFLR